MIKYKINRSQLLKVAAFSAILSWQNVAAQDSPVEDAANSPSSVESDTPQGNLEVFWEKTLEDFKIGTGYYGSPLSSGGFGAELTLKSEYDITGSDSSDLLFAVDFRGLVLTDAGDNQRGWDIDLGLSYARWKNLFQPDADTGGDGLDFGAKFGFAGEADQKFKNYLWGTQLSASLINSEVNGWRALIPTVEADFSWNDSQINGLDSIDGLLKIDAGWRFKRAREGLGETPIGRPLSHYAIGGFLPPGVSVYGGLKYWKSFKGAGANDQRDGIGAYGGLEYELKSDSERNYRALFVEAEFGDISPVIDEGTTIWVGFRVNGDVLWSSK